jgi:hypothetical protein
LFFRLEVAVVRVRMSYLVASLALIAAGPCLIGVLMPSPSAAATWVVLVAGGALASVLLVGEARRDAHAFAQYAVVALLVPATFAIAALAVAETTQGRILAAGGLAACVAALAVAIAALWRAHRARDEVPNLLLESFDEQRIFEIEGVQWAGDQGDANVSAGSFVRVVLQNCVDAERVVTVSLEDLTGVLLSRGSLATPVIEPLRLTPGEVGSLVVPVLPGARPARESSLYVSVKARGPRGRRLRTFRAGAASERTRLGFQLFALLGGHYVGGGGVKFTFTNPRTIASSVEPAPASWQPLWTQPRA